MNYANGWGMASDAFLGSTQNISEIALGVARLKYMQAMEAQRNAIALGHLAVAQKEAETQQQHYGALAQHYQALNQNELAQAALTQGKVKAAEDLGSAYQRKYKPDLTQGVTEAKPSTEFEQQVYGGGQQKMAGPTRENAAQQTMADLYSSAARSTALSGDASKLLIPHNVGENSIAVNPVTGGMVAQGPIQMASGHMYQLLGSAPVFNPNPASSSGNNAPYAYGGGIGIFNRQTGQVAVPAPSGIQDTDALRAAENPNYLLLPPEVQAMLMGKITNAVPRGVSEGRTSPNPGGKPPPSGSSPANVGANLRQDAMDAISKGANPEAVKARFKQLTGEDL